MATFEEYNERRIQDEKSFEAKLQKIYEAIEEMKADTEANAEAIEELASIIGGE
jgi:hypothetical protein